MMTGIVAFISVLSGVLLIVFIIASFVSYMEDDELKYDIYKVTLCTLSIFFASSTLLYCGYNSNVRYTKVDVHIVDGRAFLFLDKKESYVNLNDLLKANFKDGDVVYIRDSNFGPIEHSYIVRNVDE